MKYTFYIFLLSIIPKFGFTQPDTVEFDLNQSSFRKRKSNKYILDTWKFSITYYPSEFTHQDSTVFLNSDTIHLKVYSRNKLLYESLKLPKGDLTGWVKFYSKNNMLQKEEYWTYQLLASDGKNTYGRMSDSPMVTSKIVYRNGLPVKKFEKKMDYNPVLGFYKTYLKYRYKLGKVSKMKSCINIYNIN